MSQKKVYAPQDIFGAVLLIGGLFALGLFNFKSNEPLVEAGLTAQANAIVQDSVHGLTVSLDGRKITVSGLADSEAEKDAVLSDLRALDGRGRLSDQMTVLEPMTPYVLQVSHDATGISFEGAIPSEALRDTLAQTYGQAVAALPLASGAPDAEWGDMAQNALRALMQLETGRLILTDRDVVLRGTALTPAAEERALLLLETLPEGYVNRPQLTVLDDGAPLNLLAYSGVDGRVVLSGKLPADLVEQMPEGAFVAANLPVPFEGWSDAALTALTAFDQLHNAQLSLVGSTLNLTGEAWSQEAFETAKDTLKSLPSEMTVTHILRLTDDGAPFGLTLTRTYDDVQITGKVPQNLGPNILTTLVDGVVITDALRVATIPREPRWWETASIAALAVNMVEQGEIRFVDNTVTVRATLQDPAAEAVLNAHLMTLPENVTLTRDITLIDDGTPQRLILRFDGTIATATGKWPEALEIADLAGASGLMIELADYVLTPKPGHAQWTDAAKAASIALAALREGELRLTATDLRITGAALNPAAEQDMMQALASLPEGYTLVTDIRYLDDGRPFEFEISFDGNTATLSGKLPTDLGPASQSAILGFPVAPADVSFAPVPADPDWWIAARAALKALSKLDEGSLRMDAHQIALTGRAPDEATRMALEISLTAATAEFELLLNITSR